MECSNCHRPLRTDDNFCPECGGKVIRNRLTLKNLLEELSQKFLNYDNAFIRTFIQLFKHPEDVIGSYIKGIRKKYIDVVGYFAIGLTLSGIQIFILNKFFPHFLSFDQLSAAENEKFQEVSTSFLKEYQSIIFMLSVPISASLSKITFWNYKTCNFTEHIVINMYASAHFAIISSGLTLLVAPIGANYLLFNIIFLIAQIIYTTFVFKRLFKMGMGSVVKKLFLFIAVSILVYLLVGIAGAMIAYATSNVALS